jgi:hypothetical protein
MGEKLMSYSFFLFLTPHESPLLLKFISTSASKNIVTHIVNFLKAITNHEITNRRRIFLLPTLIPLSGGWYNIFFIINIYDEKQEE